MSQRATELAERFSSFNNDMIAFVENCSEEDWKKVCPGEQWPVGVVARHVAAGHYRAVGLAKMIVSGKELPELTDEAIDQSNAQHATKHADCSKEEVLDLLRKNGASLASFVTELEDADLDRTGDLAVVGGAISTQQFVENIILLSAGEHFKNMKATTRK